MPTSPRVQLPFISLIAGNFSKSPEVTFLSGVKVAPLKLEVGELKLIGEEPTILTLLGEECNILKLEVGIQFYIENDDVPLTGE